MFKWYVYNNKNPGMYQIRKELQTYLTERACEVRTNNTFLLLTELVKSTYIQRTQWFSTTVFTEAFTGSHPAKLMCLLYVPNAVSFIKADYLPKKHCYNGMCTRDGRFSVR
jgi:hypothetical protein